MQQGWNLISGHLLDFNVLPDSSLQILHNLHPTLVVYKAGHPTTLRSKNEELRKGERDNYLATSNPANSASSMYVIRGVQWEVVVDHMSHLHVEVKIYPGVILTSNNIHPWIFKWKYTQDYYFQGIIGTQECSIENISRSGLFKE